jgi:maltooligosyltrehalose trehalohydrolase
MSEGEFCAGRRLPIGAEARAEGGVHFRVWAPKRSRVAVALCRNGAQAATPETSSSTPLFDMTPEGGGYFSGIADARIGDLYGFVLDGGARIVPDPASRFQPFGPASWSQVVDGSAFPWTDHGWTGLSATGQVIYEMHIGTFTPEGDWQAAAKELPELAAGGITMFEIMPIAEFPGSFGWGYDGVAMFAPSHLYGQPDDFRRFVDRAHAVGLGVILDVVYNHFGNIDNYVREFSDHYRSTRYENEWADAINFDAENSAGVREFFVANARYWIEEFHLDGFRFDATQAIHDASPEHILSAVGKAARSAACGKSLFLVAENEPQDVRVIRPPAAGGFGFDAAWNDDFHHAARVRLTGKNPAYYSDYYGGIEEFIGVLKHGFLYQGQRSQWQGAPRGTPTRGWPSTSFVNFLQNHDQVANSLDGRRLHELTSPGRLRAMTALWLLAPQTPMFFQGQEFASSAPFLFFADYSGDIARKVHEGRKAFLRQFAALAAPESQAALTDPSDRSVFECCKLKFEERAAHKDWYAFHRDLLKLRKNHSCFAGAKPEQFDAAALSADCLAARYYDVHDDDRLLLVNFGRDLDLFPAPHPQLAPPAGARWAPLWSSETIAYGGTGQSPVEEDDGWHIPGEAAVVLRAEPIA